MEEYERVQFFIVILIITTSVLAQESHVAQGPSPSPHSVHSESRQTDHNARKLESMEFPKRAMVDNHNVCLVKGHLVRADKVGNVILVPPNCQDGFKMGADGVCREVFG